MVDLGTRRRRVLIIEDNEGDVDLVREVLAERTHITWCPSAKEARRTLARHDFDVILLDHGLPDANGLTLLSELIQAQPSRPVIMLTGREDRTLALSALEIGARYYLVKSEILEHLWPTVRRVLGEERDEPVSLGPRFADTAEGFYPRLLETISEGCVVFDDDGIVTFANRAARSFARGPLLGTPVLELLTPDTRGSLAEALERSRTSAIPLEQRFDARVLGEEQTRPMRISMHTLHAGDRFENGILVLTDTSEQVRAQELRDDVVRAMLHDLRTPLNAIYSSLTMLEALDLVDEPEEAEECISLISIGTQQLLALVDQNLDIERFEAGNLPLSCSRTDLAAQLQSAIRVQELLATNKSLEIVCTIKTRNPVGWFDAKLIGRVLQNLLGNAIRYTPSGERIVIELQRRRGGHGSSGEPSDWLRLSVIDQGPGVPPEIVDRIFDKFVRGRDGGSGLGLTFCKMVVDAHGGRIWFESLTPRGTCFVMELPASPPA